MTDPAALLPGASGEAVRDLQHRLAVLGHDVPADELGRYDAGTVAAVRRFQEARGLRPDGICRTDTWAALVESGFRLGDRLLYRRRPMLRGDDVAELQRLLNALGFDAGREDGILGDETAAALGEFQRNAGIATDGVCGPATVTALRRLGTPATGSVATVREREALRRPRGIGGRRIAVVAAPGFGALGEALTRGLNAAGARAVLDVTGDERGAAADANRWQADLVLGIQPGEQSDCRCNYFSAGAFRSETGYLVARALQDELRAAIPGHVADEPCGRSYPLLRETRMAAVVCEPAPRGDVVAMRVLVQRSGDVARAMVRGVRRALEQPLDGLPTGT